VIVVPHHLPVFKWWNFPEVSALEMGGPLPAMTRQQVDKVQPVAEVFSKVHGNNESAQLKNWIKPPTCWTYPLLDTFWLNGLMEGVRAGAVCAGDNHYTPLGHPYHTGLTAVLAPGPSREDIFRAIQNRRTYGTSGYRVFIDFRIGTARMGDIVPGSAPGDPPTLDVTVIAPVSIEYVEVVKVIKRNFTVAHTEPVNGQKEVVFSWEDPAYNPAKWVCYYLRVHLDRDKHGAWTSPIWFDPEIAPGA
jgi:hypothetical protein